MARVGLDIGATHVRACRLRRRGKELQVAATAEASRHDANGVRRPLAVVLAEVHGQLSLGGEVTVAASDLNLLIRYLSTIPMPPDRLERLLRLEMQQQAGSEGDDDLAADAQVLPVPGEELVHCCVHTQAGQVDGLLAELGAAGIRPERIHAGPVALGNVFATDQALEPDGYGLVLDIGAKHTTVALQRGDCLQACRQIAFGGDDFSEALAREWGVRFERAEQAKCKGDVVSAREEGGGGRITSYRESTDLIIKNYRDSLRRDGWKRPEERDAADAQGRDETAGTPPDGSDTESDTGSPAQGQTAEYHPGPAPGGTDAGEREPLSAGHRRGPGKHLQFSQSREDDGLAKDLIEIDRGLEMDGQAPGPRPDEPGTTVEEPGTGVEVAPEAGSVHDLLKKLDGEEDADRGDGDADEAVDPSAETLAAEDGDAKDERSWQRQEDFLHPETAEMPAVGLQTAHYSSLTMGPELTACAEKLAAQAQSTLNWFKAQLKLKGITLQRVSLCGGGGDLVGLDTYLARRFRVPCRRLNPFHAMSGAVPEHGQRFAAALGLALSGLPDKLTYDLRPEGMLRRRLFWTRILWPRVAAVIVFLAAGVLGVKMWLNLGTYEDIADAYDAHKRAHDRYEDALGDKLRTRRDLKKDYHAIVGRLFGGRDMLMTIRSLKEHAPDELWIQTFRTTPLSLPEEVDPDEVNAPGRLDNPGRDGGGRDGRDGRGGRPAGPAIHDTMLDRGSLYLSGYVKPGDEAASHHEILVKWLREVQDWHPPGSDVPMFHRHSPPKTKWEPGEEGFWFNVRLDFHPARLTQVPEGY